MTRPQAQEPWDWPPTVERFKEIRNRFTDDAGMACYFGVPREGIHNFAARNGLGPVARATVRHLTADNGGYQNYRNFVVDGER